MDRPKSVAKWGAACAPCASAKAKCLRSSDNHIAKCDRCERLFKDCVNQTHKPRKKRASKPSKTAQLEQRLNGLVDLLKASGDGIRVEPGNIAAHELRDTIAEVACISQDHLDINLSAASQPRSSPQDDGSDEEDEEPREPRDENAKIHVPKHYNSFAPSTCICHADPGWSPGPTETDETILSVYQTHMTALFPFVIIPPGATPDELETSRPFLFSAVRMVTSLTSMKSMRAQMYKLMEQVADRMLIRSEKSFDLLQGIIVMVAWYHYHCGMHAQMNNLIHLAQSLIADMGLNRHPKLQERTSLMVLYPDEPTPRSNEERRALLGVWYLSSSVSSGFGRIESMGYSPYVQLCLRELHESKEYETDMILYHMVRLQNLSEKIAELNSREEGLEDICLPRAPASAFTSTFQAELDKIQASISKTLRNNKYLMVYVYSVGMRLYEPPIIDTALLTKFHSDLTSLNEHTPSALDRFYRASHALQAYFSHWFTIPISSYFYLPLPVCIQIIYSTTMLARWAKIASPLSRNPGPRIGVVDPSAGSKIASPTIPISKVVRQRVFSAKGCLGIAPPPNFDDVAGPEQAASSRTTTTSTTSPESLVQPLAGVRFRETTDPNLPVIVAALKQYLNAQPGLRIDATGILSQFASRCAQASQEMMQVSGGDADRNIWDLACKKVNITRAKLQRWAEIVAQGGPSAFRAPMPGEGNKDGKSVFEHPACNAMLLLGFGPTEELAEKLAEKLAMERMKSPIDKVDRGLQQPEQQQQRQQHHQQQFESSPYSNGNGVEGEGMATVEGYGAMNIDPQLTGSFGESDASGLNCSNDYWFSGALDEMDQSLWDTAMMDWGPVNIF